MPEAREIGIHWHTKRHKGLGKRGTIKRKKVGKRVKKSLVETRKNRNVKRGERMKGGAQETLMKGGERRKHCLNASDELEVRKTNKSTREAGKQKHNEKGKRRKAER